MMKTVKKALIWYYMLNKRLLKKIGFILILALIPILAFCMTFFVETEETGLMRIALVAKDPTDPVVAEMIGGIQSDGNVFAFTVMDSVEEARRCVENKSIDAAWLFEADFKTKVTELINGNDVSLVTVYAVQDSIFFKASREKIFSVLLPEISYQMYVTHTEDMLPEDITVTPEELYENYVKYNGEDRIIDFAFLSSDQVDVEQSNFLTSTIRGLMSVVMLLCGLASTMYFVNDEKKGTYSWLTAKKRLLVMLSSNFAALFIAGVFVTVALALSNNITSVPREIGLMLLFAMMTAAFCAVVGAVCNSVGKLALALPTLMVASLVLCPIFFNTDFFKPLQMLLPPYLYLYAVNDLGYVKWMLLYLAVAVIVAYVVYCVIRCREVPSFKTNVKK